MTTAPTAAPSRWQRLAGPLAVFAVCASVYVGMLRDRRMTPSPDNHYVHLAESFLHGELGVVGNRAPGDNDWALYHGKWFVSFPPFPAIVILPIVAIAHTTTPDRLVFAILAGIAPALLFFLLRRLREEGRSTRTPREDLGLVALYAFGSVFFFVAVQGTVWFAAQVVASTLLMLHVLFGLGARRPELAGLVLGLAVMTRGPSAVAAFPFFLIEALGAARRADSPAIDDEAHFAKRALTWLRGVDLKRAIVILLRFGAPIILIGLLAMWFNNARFDDPMEFGHRYLQVRWHDRIEKWGLFSYHYLGRNLGVFFASVPWLSAEPPHLLVSAHGLAFWVTMPWLVLVLWPKRVDATMVALSLAAALVAIWNLLYQNSGWIQFGYRFSLDYLPYLVVLLVLGRRKLGPVFWILGLLAIVVNTFGAITFDRAMAHYHIDANHGLLFQPD